jgi:2-polyprenyl-3-methyl-5-hydroxy-6-metoxy-1,4-benzoquinol methylase
MSAEFYNVKCESYYSEWRQDVFNVIKSLKRFNKSLEVGCAGGKLSTELKKEGLVNYAVGVEPYSKIDDDALIDVIYGCGIEEVLAGKLKGINDFDLIILPDVLEHTVDPWGILHDLSKLYLRDDGVVVISLPNIRNFMSLKKILFNSSFQYQSEGVFDKTHLRFFCISDMLEMCEKAGLKVNHIVPAYEMKDYVFFSKNRLKIINKLSLGMFSWLLADQVLLTCSKRIQLNEL